MTTNPTPSDGGVGFSATEQHRTREISYWDQNTPAVVIILSMIFPACGYPETAHSRACDVLMIMFFLCVIYRWCISALHTQKMCAAKLVTLVNKVRDIYWWFISTHDTQETLNVCSRTRDVSMMTLRIFTWMIHLTWYAYSTHNTYTTYTVKYTRRLEYIRGWFISTRDTHTLHIIHIKYTL